MTTLTIKIIYYTNSPTGHMNVYVEGGIDGYSYWGSNLDPTGQGPAYDYLIYGDETGGVTHEDFKNDPYDYLDRYVLPDDKYMSETMQIDEAEFRRIMSEHNEYDLQNQNCVDFATDILRASDFVGDFNNLEFPPWGESGPGTPFYDLPWTPAMFAAARNDFLDPMISPIKELFSPLLATLADIPDFFRDPLVVDLDGDGIELISREDSGAFFDMDNDGFAENTGWVSGDDGILVLDGNGDGLITDLSELIGSGFVSPAASTDNLNEGPTGFEELATFDLNSDGVIDTNDAIYTEMQVWRDLDGDGVSDEGELFSLSEVGVASIGLGYTELVANPDEALDVLGGSGATSGNVITQEGTFTWADGSAGTVGDVWMTYDPMLTVTTENIERDPDVFDMPFILGLGEVLDLDLAMSKDGLLKEMVADLQTLSVADASEYASKVEDMIMQWAGVADIDAQSRGHYTDGQYLAAVEKFMGFDFLQVGKYSDPFPIAGAGLMSIFKDLQAKIMVAILPQIDLAVEIMPTLSGYMGSFLELEAGTTLSTLLSNLEANAPEANEGAELFGYWNSMALLVHSLKDQLPEDDATIASEFSAVLETQGLDFTYDQMREALVGGDGDDVVVGSQDDPFGGGNFGLSQHNVIFGGAGDDLLAGRAGGDTYVFGYGSGHDVIDEGLVGWAHANGSENSIKFLPGVTVDDVVFSTTEGALGKDLVIELTSTGETLTIKNEFAATVSIVGTFEFADGTVLDVSEVWASFFPPTEGGGVLRAMPGRDTVLNGGPGDDYFYGGTGNDTLNGGSGDDFIDGDSGNDTLSGGSGDDRLDGGSGTNDLTGGTGNDYLETWGGTDTYHFNIGDGQDTIADAYGVDKIVFGAGVTASDLVYKVPHDNPSDFIITYSAGGDSVRILNARTNNDWVIESIEFCLTSAPMEQINGIA